LSPQTHNKLAHFGIATIAIIKLFFNLIRENRENMMTKFRSGGITMVFVGGGIGVSRVDWDGKLNADEMLIWKFRHFAYLQTQFGRASSRNWGRT
jgi:hypothetical protein